MEVNFKRLTKVEFFNDIVVLNFEDEEDEEPTKIEFHQESVAEFEQLAAIFKLAASARFVE